MYDLVTVGVDIWPPPRGSQGISHGRRPMLYFQVAGRVPNYTLPRTGVVKAAAGERGPGLWFVERAQVWRAWHAWR
jgi:hypothetical protein